MSLRPATLIWMLFLACGFLGLYMVKYRVQAVKAEVASVERQLMDEKKSLHVLEAEWSYLNRPERLANLSAKYLRLNKLSGQQLADFKGIPIGDPANVIRQAGNRLLRKPATTRSVALASGAGHGR